jgi:hypothetical protein
MSEISGCDSTDLAAIVAAELKQVTVEPPPPAAAQQITAEAPPAPEIRRRGRPPKSETRTTEARPAQKRRALIFPDAETRVWLRGLRDA